MLTSLAHCSASDSMHSALDYKNLKPKHYCFTIHWFYYSIYSILLKSGLQYSNYDKYNEKPQSFILSIALQRHFKTLAGSYRGAYITKNSNFRYIPWFWPFVTSAKFYVAIKNQHEPIQVLEWSMNYFKELLLKPVSQDEKVGRSLNI